MDLNLRQQLGQLFMVGFDGLTINASITKMITEYRIGGVILFRRNISDALQLASLCRALQELNARHSDIPLLIALDQEGGMVMRIEQDVTPMPSAMAYQEAGSVEDCASLHGISAAEMRALGINMMLAPVLDINNNVHNPVIGVRAFGDNPATVIDYGLAAMRAIQAQGVVATVKHFPGHGDTTADSHFALPVIKHDRQRLDRVELAPFRAAIAQGAGAVMTAHVCFPAVESESGLPATLSRAVVTGLLRDELGFDGVIMTDCLEMSAIATGFGVVEGALRSLQAGTDLILISHSEAYQVAALERIVVALDSGGIDLTQIHASLNRIRRLKQFDAVHQWQQNAIPPIGLKQATGCDLAHRVQAAAVRSIGQCRRLDVGRQIVLMTVTPLERTEIDEVTASTATPYNSMAPLLSEAGLNVLELVLPLEPVEADVLRCLAAAGETAQILVQTYNAVLFDAQQNLLQRLPAARSWLVAGRLPYDLDLMPDAQGRLAAFGCQPAALRAVVEQLLLS